MSLSQMILPVTKARGQLGKLADRVAGEEFVVLTKGGEPKVALVGWEYFQELKGEVDKIYGRTFIDPKTLPYTREFSDQEIKAWLEEDQL